ncbi:MAG: J domain-containing protein [Desulfobaccales bacterium]
MKKNFYRTLGVPRDATPEEIKRRFHRLAHQWHPDKNPGNRAAEDRFKELNEAYTVLSDEVKRARFDTFGTIDSAFSMPPLNLDAIPVAGFILKALGKVAGVRFPPPGGFGARTSVKLTLEEATAGVEKIISYRRLMACPSCRGTGDARKVMPAPCSFCGGMGARPAIPGFEGIEVICRFCKGTGFLVTSRCRVCRGTGTFGEASTIKVAIPPGAAAADEISVPRGGHYTRRDGYGALTVSVELLPHPVFRRSGLDITCEAVISVSDAASGVVMEIPGLTGRYTVKVPRGVHDGQILRLSRMGISDPEGNTGDLHVRLLVR